MPHTRRAIKKKRIGGVQADGGGGGGGRARLLMAQAAKAALEYSPLIWPARPKPEMKMERRQ